jgi:phosphoadenosine phosphosulfate reductase
VSERRSVEELQEIALAAGERFAGASGIEGAEQVASWAALEFGAPGGLAVASSMQDAVLPHLVSRFARGVDVVFLDTGYHFADTLGTRDAVAATLPVTVINARPRQTVAQQDAEHGPRLYERDPALCCRLRKVQPLTERLRGYEAWMTGVRREEAPTRAQTPVVSWDDRHGLVKINPLAAWTFDEVLAYVEQHDVPVNPLLGEGYPSIGCAPCTRAVAPGEDARAGRWAGLAKTECGIHA